MRSVLLVATVCCSTVLASSARAGECGDLWFARNQIYKSAGYCFRTARAIQTFGNAGCSYDDVRDVPLSYRDRSQVDQIVRQESMMGCRD